MVVERIKIVVAPIVHAFTLVVVSSDSSSTVNRHGVVLVVIGVGILVGRIYAFELDDVRDPV